MRVRFWGTRGSIATPGPATLRYGGNTVCVEVRSDAGTLVVIDCGTGARGLGQSLMAEGPLRPHGHILISHTHWDHIQGLPFFAPLFVPGNEWDIYGPRGLAQSLRETLAGQMQYTYFPVTLEQLGASIRYHDLVEGVFEIGDITVRTQYVNHPALTLGYRLEADGACLVYASDHEPFAPRLAGGTGTVEGRDLHHAEFLAGADLVIHDAQYTAAEYGTKTGWGHSTGEYAVAVARAAGAKRLALIHYDPLRDDEALDRVVAGLRASIGPAGGPPLEVFAAAEGGVVEIRGPGRRHCRADGPALPRCHAHDASPGRPVRAPGRDDALPGQDAHRRREGRGHEGRHGCGRRGGPAALPRGAAGPRAARGQPAAWWWPRAPARRSAAASIPGRPTCRWSSWPRRRTLPPVPRPG